MRSGLAAEKHQAVTHRKYRKSLKLEEKSFRRNISLSGVKVAQRRL